MKIKPSSLIDIYRLSNNPQVMLKALSVWAFFSLTIIGGFGIYPEARRFFKSIKIYPKMVQINKDLEKKIVNINSEYSKIEKNPIAIGILDNYVPKGYNLQNFIVDLSFAAAKHNFQLVLFSPSGNYQQENSNITVQVNFKGDGDLKDLVKEIESLKRIAEINSVTLIKDHDVRVVKVELNIYILE